MPPSSKTEFASFDVFISHASEDKDSVARPLAALLKEAGLNVWLDQFELLLGDSLRRKIEIGLSQSRYGVVILSNSFFDKEWPQKELDALVAREDGSDKVILPVWHKISRKDVVARSPLLADRLSASTDSGLRSVAAAITNVVGKSSRPEASNFDEIGQPTVRNAIAPISIGGLMAEFLDRINCAAGEITDVTGLRTGFYDLDKLTTGLQPGELYVVAARPSMGCTTLSLNIAEHIAISEGVPVLFYSPRAKSQEILNRLIASSGRINRLRLATGQLLAEEWERFVDAADRVGKTAFFIDDTSSLTVESLCQTARYKYNELGALGLIVVDNLEALTLPNTPTADEDLIRQLWSLARQCNCAVILNMTIPRAADSRLDKRPIMADVRAADAVEQCAAAVMFLYRDDYYNRDSNEPGVVEVILARHRGGYTGTILLLFEPTLARMENSTSALARKTSENFDDQDGEETDS